MGNHPVLDCKYFNKCSKCMKLHSCSIGALAGSPTLLPRYIKTIEKFKKERRRFICTNFELCKFGEECYKLSHGDRDDGGTINVEP